MLDNETKRRIDDARDILVGKIPDPKSQIEQITIALIYKFMDDMDRESIEMDGEREFFSETYEKYSWSNIFNPQIGGYEMLNLYSEAINRMSENPNIPQLFRDIFKNAFLPYRDPETLKLFLKTINEFQYDHSERLGDAFEYLLSIMGSQGDAGQFRTPRHIIDFMVDIINPQTNEIVLDPACGTAGFLISAFKHIRTTGMLKDNIEQKNLFSNFNGYDISPDMVRMSLVNLYLHGFQQPRIYEYDTLTSEERWKEYADVILANPPFMSPKGGIKPHSKFSIQSNRSEVLFLDYIIEHLTANGRAAVIVPEGIIFQSGNAYKQIREKLIKGNFLVTVISLPAGVFNPYSGVKTSILILDRVLSKISDKILFLKIENDGFALGAQRKQIEKNDLPDALNVIKEWFKAIRENSIDSIKPGEKPCQALLVEKNEIANNGEYNLNGDRYRIQERRIQHRWPMVSLGNQDFFSVESGGTPDSKIKEYWNGNIYWATLIDLPSTDHISIIKQTERMITESGLANSSAKVIPVNSVIVSTRATIGRVGINKIPLATNQGFKNIIIKDHQKVLPKFLAYMVKSLTPKMENFASGGTFREISKTNFCKLEIPLPAMEVQREIVLELEEYQKIVNGAREVVENWKPKIEIDPKWPILNLDEVCEIVRGSSPRPKSDKRYYGGAIPRLMVADITRDGMYVSPKIDFLTEEGAKLSRPMKKGDLVIVVSGQPGICSILNIDACIHDGIVGLRNLDNKKILTEFAFLILSSSKDLNNKQSVGAVFLNLKTDQIKNLKIPIPSLEIQKRIVDGIEKERIIVDGCRDFITLYNTKIKNVIEKLWN